MKKNIKLRKNNEIKSNLTKIIEKFFCPTFRYTLSSKRDS